jgi:hypothetical protein
MRSLYGHDSFIDNFPNETWIELPAAEVQQLADNAVLLRLVVPVTVNDYIL